MSVTRLLVLGAVRLFQPAHGYLVRRELISWQVEEWGHLNPGSIYNALRSLARDGLLIGEAPDEPETGGARSRTTYRLTDDGETEFHRLIRVGLWELHPFQPEWLLAGMSFWSALGRAEVLDALAARHTQLEARITATGYSGRMVAQSAFKPAAVIEHFHLHTEYLRAELAWVQDVSDRIRSGAYWFDGEPGHLIPALDQDRDATTGIRPSS